MDRESAGRTGKSIDRFTESEMIISSGFMVSARKMFGDSYKAIIRNLSHEYRKPIIKYLSGDTRLFIIFWNGIGKPQRKQQLSVSSVVNLSHNPIPRKKIKSLGDTDMTNMTDVERLQLFSERGVSAYDVKAKREDGKLVLTAKHCRHHLGKDVREKIGISSTRVCPVGILATCLIRNVMGRIGSGGRKDVGEYDETGECIIRFDLTED